MKSTEMLRIVKICLRNISQQQSSLSAQQISDFNSTSQSQDDRVNNWTYIDNITESDLNISTVCRLWAGKGHIYRVTVQGSSNTSFPLESIIVKHITQSSSSVGSSTQRLSLSDERKALSYEVEANFFEKLAPSLIEQFNLPIPRPYCVERGKSIIIAMSYIIPPSRGSVSYNNSNKQYVKLVLDWLATFHGSYWGSDNVTKIVSEIGLQPIGSYWHLLTRPDEHSSMPNNNSWEGRLKLAAKAIHDRLHERDEYQCIIHGDVKDANVLLHENNNDANNDNDNKKTPCVAMCDFQYCGKAPPTVDLAYFFCTSVGGKEDSDHDEYVEYYLQKLESVILSSPSNLQEDIVLPTIEQFQESLDLAYCDFYRFMSGWGFWGSGGKHRVLRVLNRLDHGTKLKSENDYENAMLREYG